MAAYVDQGYYGWSHDELPHQDETQDVSASQLLEHGSISFGRFAYESLSWEKRSVFTYNKCEEELEKFKSQRGLVAKKKAYFEEYYKKIRAMKALEESQQTEMTLDYSGDGSVSSQTAEEDETTTQLENTEGTVAVSIGCHLDGAPVKVPMEVNEGCTKELEVHVGYSGTESEELIPGQSGNDTKGHRQEEETVPPRQTRQLDIDASVHESLTITIEEDKHQGLSGHDDKEILRGNNMSVTNIDPEVASIEAPSCLTSSKAGDMELKPAPENDRVPKKVIPAARKCKDNVSVSLVKGSSGSVRNTPKLAQKAKLKCQTPPNGPKRMIQMKSGNAIGSSKSTPDRVSRNSKFISTVPHRPLAEVHSNITIPRPFSLATDRRANLSSGSREGASKLISKPSGQKSPSFVKVKDTVTPQGAHKRALVTSSLNSRGLENKRCHEEIKKPATVGNQPTKVKARGTNVPGPLKSRSVDLPAWTKFSSNCGTDKSAAGDDKHKEGRPEVKVAELSRTGSKVFTPAVVKCRIDPKVSTTPAAKLKTETKKVTPSWMTTSMLSTRKPRFGEQSLDGKKPRQDKPRWR